MRSSHKEPWMASLLSPHCSLTILATGKPVLSATASGIFRQAAPTMNVPTAWVSALVTPSATAFVTPPYSHLHPCPCPSWGIPLLSITPPYVVPTEWSLPIPLPLGVTGVLEFRTVILAPPTSIPWLTPTTTTSPRAQMEIPTSVVPPLTGTSDLQGFYLTLLWSFRGNTGVMLQFFSYTILFPWITISFHWWHIHFY